MLLYFVIIGECIAGALWWRELVDLCKEVGLSGPYLVASNITEIEKEEHKKVLGIYLTFLASGIVFSSQDFVRCKQCYWLFIVLSGYDLFLR